MTADVLVANLAAKQLPAISQTQAGRISAYFLVFTLKYRHDVVFVSYLAGNTESEIGTDCLQETDAISLKALTELIGNRPCCKWATID